MGPDQTQPCGVADYTSRLGEAMAAKCDLVFVPFREALTTSALAECRAILVQYERSLVSGPGFIPALCARHPGKVFVVPHEVYAEDPFAFPYADLRSAFPPLLWAKRLRYRWRHRAYAREKRLQARGYGAYRVIPLSGPGADILRGLSGADPARILEPVPHAFFDPPASLGAAKTKRTDFFPAGIRSIIGIFGFLNPGLDYGSALDLLAELDAATGLLILGGPRPGARRVADTGFGASGSANGHGSVDAWLAGEIEGRGLARRVRVTGYVSEAALADHLRLCDIFLAPLRFKSNSGSLLHLFHVGKPILAADLPLTRWLRGQGAPLELYTGVRELVPLAKAALAQGHQGFAGRYPWSFPAVADAYLRILSRG
ncbi:MAG: glycosyltransferase [Fibrobacteria bacterium]